MFSRNNKKIFHLKILNDSFAIKRFYWQFDRDKDGLKMSKTGGSYKRLKKKFNLCILYIKFCFFFYDRFYYMHFYKYIYVYVRKLKMYMQICMKTTAYKCY